ncbi:hypothetical protein GBA63_22655 (plasmid) [Rubrobacter tropicus]|uniref:Uncharacterized protein n=1 Tax=Rubrobacter tropicus TaxID=2653851 RepID=A0A6G8QGG1_9ACTN|nr:glycosyltransferase [Rubrobacter tropicus]QIN85501.1 hypothetical protein GBA63_22655 [Rubrobacter tropicus]
MRIALVTGGSRGDAQPYIALGAELRRRGHEVVAVTYAPYEGMAEDAGLRFVRVSGDAVRIVEELTEAGGNVRRYARRFRQVTEPHLQKNFEEILEGCREADAVVYASVAVLGYFAARELDVPAFMAEMQPVFEPTTKFPSAIVPEGPRGLRTAYNWLSYAVVRQVYWRTFRPMLANIGDVDLGAIPRLRGPWPYLRRTGAPVLCAWSPRVLPRPAGWDDRFRVTGYWFFDRPSTWTPPAELEEFLGGGAPTIAVGFSSVRSDAKIRADLDRILRAADANGVKVVFVGGWSGIPGSDLPAGALAVEEAPHDWLFPRVSAAIHHGGAGTTAAALRAGVPSVVMPFSADQAFWGRALVRVGAGILYAEHREGPGGELERAVAAAVGNRLQAGAQAIGDDLRAERGTALAAEVIERSCARC